GVRTLVERKGDIDPQRTDRRVVTDSGTRADPQRTVQGVQVPAHISGIDEDCGTEIRADALAPFDTARIEGGAADGVAVWELRAHGLVPITADRAATACVEA